MRDDSNPDFLREYHRALAVVCDDLFFARYRRSTGFSQSLAKATGTQNVEQAALQLLQAMFGDCRTEEEKIKMVEDLLDVKLLPGTNLEGVHFNKERIEDRYSISSCVAFCVACEAQWHIGITLSGFCLSVHVSVCPVVTLSL